MKKTCKIGSPEYLQHELIRYRDKIRQFKGNYNNAKFNQVLSECGYTEDKLRSILSKNNADLLELCKKLFRINTLAIGNINSIWYTATITKLLDIIGEPYDVHGGFALPIKLSGASAYANSKNFVNYTWAVTGNGVAYHYLNGEMSESDITIITDFYL